MSEAWEFALLLSNTLKPAGRLFGGMGRRAVATHTMVQASALGVGATEVASTPHVCDPTNSVSSMRRLLNAGAILLPVDSAEVFAQGGT